MSVRPGGTGDVVAFYDTHPINESQVLAALAARGFGEGPIPVEALSAHDQDHFGGVEATDALAQLACVSAGQRLLDVCSGLGGPARWLAHRTGCTVTGLDLNRGRVAGASRLTGRAGLEGLVQFVQGDALRMPFPDGCFHVVMGQEAWCHVPHKAALLAECRRVLAPGGVVAFTDILRTGALLPAEMERLSRDMAFPSLETLEGYAASLDAAGFEVLQVEDLSTLWTEVLVERLAMYRSLGPGTARAFGAARSADWDAFYAFFVGLYQLGRLGGGRFLARARDPAAD